MLNAIPVHPVLGPLAVIKANHVPKGKCYE